MGKRRAGDRNRFMLIGLLLVSATTFLQNLVDYYQSRSQGAYQPTLQRILILGVLVLSMLALIFSYMATSKTRSPFTRGGDRRG